MEDQAAIWDEILAASARRLESTTTSARPSAPTFRLRKTPEARHLPGLERYADLIAPELRVAIRGLLLGTNKWPLFVHGAAGTGKTRAALCLLDYCETSVYRTVGELCDTLIQAQQGRLEWYHDGHGGKTWPENIWKAIRMAAVVVLDEIGTRERVSDFTYDTVKRVIDEREGKPLVCCSNMDLPKIERLYDDRIASRLAAGIVIHLVGADRRLKGT